MANYKKLTFGVASVLIAVAASVSASAGAYARDGANVEYTYALVGGGPVFFQVPDGVTQLDVDLYGASGGTIGVYKGVAGGKGGHTHAKLAVQPDQYFWIVLGGAGQGTHDQFPYLGGYNGGGAGGEATTARGAGGGGATDLRLGSFSDGQRLLVAGGGGGAGRGWGNVGGAGGGTQGNDGGGDASGSSPGGGYPGTQRGPGKGGWGLYWLSRAGYNADGPKGGAGGGFQECERMSGGGGGGGYYGGGGGGASCNRFDISGGGAGGSGYVVPDALEATLETGVHSGDGKAVIRFSLPQ